MRTNIGIAMVCMVNSTAYLSKGSQVVENVSHVNEAQIEEKGGCKKPTDYSAQDMGYSVRVSILLLDMR